jgi:hypothetical protein
MIALNSTVRFATLKSLKAQARQANFIKFEHAQDDRGFYFTGVELHPTVAKLCEEQDARAREAAAKRLATGADQEPSEMAKAGAARVRKLNKDPDAVPVTKQIRDWVHANPAATKAEAQAHFSHLNPGTVGVQFGAAKRGVI